MQYSLAKEIFGTPWQISALGLQQYLPVARGMLNGAHIVRENEPRENIPSLVSASKLTPVMEIENDNYDQEPEEKVVHVLPVRGVMMKHDMACGPVGTRTLAKRLRAAEKKDAVLGHVLIIEGPGGSADAVPELADAISECKKPVVAWIDGLMASAHMYVGSYADERIASRGTDQIGSIGTLIVFQGRKSQSEEDLFKVREVTIYSDDAFEKNDEYEKAINDFNFKPAKEHILNPHNERFVNDIRANCSNVEDKHLHGRIFPASEVLGSLIDSIGDFETAVRRVVSLSDYKQPEAAPAANGFNNNTMKFTQIQKTLALSDEEFVTEADGRRTFTTEEMEALENSLGESTSEDLQPQLDAANAIVAQRDETIAQLTEQLEAANGLVAERDTTIEQLNGEIADLREEPAAPTAPVAKPTGDGADSGPISERYENPFDALDKVAEEYLGKSLK